jgi:hypothetical protein
MENHVHLRLGVHVSQRSRMEKYRTYQCILVLLVGYPEQGLDGTDLHDVGPRDLVAGGPPNVGGGARRGRGGCCVGGTRGGERLDLVKHLAELAEDLVHVVAGLGVSLTFVLEGLCL